ncbi:MBOAT family protein [Ruminococcus sp. OA3]|uniref:MBOAT family O-acyltransferase n=1 Tax=Ruminococcus sp. OA3 TaxID=2914164 RepID=UPI001F06A0B6|nr:MBOAT family O-acyltransferase [Ruminococcus sp. OA3]MCH1983813.1 MBOAT family protein [Ruminococcus sp. OA3]
MSLISLQFLVFTAIAVTGYYLIPMKYQWQWLLGFSYIYYLSAGVKLVAFLLFSTATTYLAARRMYALDQGEADKKKVRSLKRSVLVLTLFLNFGMLALLKYTNFAIGNINAVFHTDFQLMNLLLPLGISFYTFQSMGYLLDVYWGKCKPERNPFKFALFVSFFPQILQGPISRFSALSKELFAEHAFDMQRTQEALLRILWGFFKKMVIADNAAMFVDVIFGNSQAYSGMAILGVLGYTVQLYGDFSGGMDVVIGIASLFGIRLEENFKRPFFAVSITDFWHRWHITLGTWMKDYIFYPVSLSKWMGHFTRRAKKIFGKSIGRTLPICLANIIVFLVVGIWHGAAWKFIAYGLYNGVIIAFSGLMAGNYRKWKKACNIRNDSRWFHVFQILRTFLLVNISWFLDRGSDLGQAFAMMKNAVTKFDLSPLLRPGFLALADGNPNVCLIFLGIVLAGCVLLFFVSYRQECGTNVAAVVLQSPCVVRFGIVLILVLSLPLLGADPSMAGGFIYAQF